MESNQSCKIPKSNIWERCIHCTNLHFNCVSEFETHLRKKHTISEGSIILCTYGSNGICAALQFGDLTQGGYMCHVKQHHTTETTSNRWNFYSSSQNLPAVLNDPNRAKQANFFTKTWGDGFIDKVYVEQCLFLPDIHFGHFESYCKKIIKRYRRHTRLVQLSLHSKPRTASVNEANSKIPDIFYQPKLDLSKANIFNNVFPNVANSHDIPGSIRLLQESLSTYLDVVEMKISKQVARKSDAFFHAMLSHDTIMDQMNSALQTVRRTRNDLSATKSNLASRPLKLVCLSTKRKNMENIYDKLKLMATVQQTQPMIQLLLSTSDYVSALDLIASTQSVLSTQLIGVHAFRHLSQQLNEMERLIDKMLSNEFSRYAIADLNRSFSDLTELPEKDKLTSIISGVIRLKKLEFIDTYKSEADTTIQATVKQALIEIMSERDESVEIVLRSSNVDNTLLAPGEAILFLERVTPTLLVIIKRINCVCNLILSVSQMEDLQTVQSEDAYGREDQRKVEEKVKKILFSLTDYCGEKCANAIFPKNEKQHLLITLGQISLFSKLIEEFTLETERVTGHISNAFKLAFRSYSMKFIQHVHNERKNALTLSLRNEQWRICEVSPELQNIVNMILQCDFALEMVYKPHKLDGKFLVINNEHYAVVGSTQILISIIFEYCKIAKILPINVQYVLHCLLELLRYFNSRSCQLVLGAEALQHAGLTTITTANLALVSRSLQLISWILPSICYIVKSVSNNELSINGFDVLVRDIKNHQEEIENKIYLIVSNMLASQLTNWDARPPVPSQTFRNISKHLVKLHEALSNILPLSQIQSIYRRVHENFKGKLKEQLSKMNIVANGGPQHGVVTSELTFYLQTLKTLQVISDNNGIDDRILYEIW